MFIYVDSEPYNVMGIRGNLDELYTKAKGITEELLSQNCHSEIQTKITMYI
jgi:hypothetical protein